MRTASGSRSQKARTPKIETIEKLVATGNDSRCLVL